MRALNGLVRLQALVRGHIERKWTAEWLHKMQALLQAQTQGRAGRPQIFDSSQSSSKSSRSQHPVSKINFFFFPPIFEFSDIHFLTYSLRGKVCTVGSSAL